MPVIPAAKHAPVLALLNWHPFHAMTLHMWCGRLSFFGSFIHFFCYILKYAVRGVYNGYNPVQFFVPIRECFYVLQDAELPHDCGKMLNRLFGTLAIFFFAVLMVCSIKTVRRHRYMLFYISHIVWYVPELNETYLVPPFPPSPLLACVSSSHLFLVILVMHWNRAHYYLWPSMFYYAAAVSIVNCSILNATGYRQDSC